MGQVVFTWLIQQGPVTVLAIIMWWYERRRADRAEQRLEDCLRGRWKSVIEDLHPDP